VCCRYKNLKDLLAQAKNGDGAGRAAYRSEEHGAGGRQNRRQKNGSGNKIRERLEKNFGLDFDETRESLTGAYAWVKAKKGQKKNRIGGRKDRRMSKRASMRSEGILCGQT
jgi:hypothetical protein